MPGFDEGKKKVGKLAQKISQGLLFSSSFVGVFSKVVMSCAFLDLFILEVGAENLAFYYSVSAVLTFLVSMLLLSFSERLCAIYTFLTLHSLVLGCAISCFWIPDPIVRAGIGFVTIMGTGIVGYFSTWSLASYLISPFEAKRLFPWVSTLAQLGAVGDNFKPTRTRYRFLSWLMGSRSMCPSDSRVHSPLI